MKITEGSIENYCTQFSGTHSPTCAAIAQYTNSSVEDAQMLIGQLEGSFLKWIIHVLGARRVLEIGTFTGYSALTMAEQLPDDGELVTLDINADTNAIATRFWSQSSHGKKIHSIIGPAAQSIRTLKGQFDFVFIDADKEGYREYCNEALKLLSPKGVIVVDNCLYSGQVLESSPLDANAKEIKLFNEYVRKRTDLIVSLLPVRDGIYLIAKR